MNRNETRNGPPAAPVSTTPEVGRQDAEERKITVRLVTPWMTISNLKVFPEVTVPELKNMLYRQTGIMPILYMQAWFANAPMHDDWTLEDVGVLGDLYSMFRWVDRRLVQDPRQWSDLAQVHLRCG